MNKLLLILLITVYFVINTNNNVMTALIENRVYNRFNQIYSKPFDPNYYKKFNPGGYYSKYNPGVQKKPFYGGPRKIEPVDTGRCEIKIITDGTCTVNKHLIHPKIAVQHSTKLKDY